jgi:hypothetical protein
MVRCEICGTEFDPLGFQVVVPELGAGFDRVECAREARKFAPAGTPPAVVPLAAVAEPVPASAAAAHPLAVDRERWPVLGAAGLGLLAAGTAASVFLWLRILGADPSMFSLPGSPAPSAVERRAVPAEIVAAPERDAAPVLTRPDTASEGSTDRGGVLAAPTSASAQPAVAGGPLRISTVLTRRSVERTPTRTREAVSTLRSARPSQQGARKGGADAQHRAPGRSSGHEHGHGHGKGKKLGHSKHR